MYGFYLPSFYQKIFSYVNLSVNGKFSNHRVHIFHFSGYELMYQNSNSINLVQLSSGNSEITDVYQADTDQMLPVILV